jgi:drug/metabolite transporter (DMT)-like permease
VSEQTSAQRPRRIVKLYSRWYRAHLFLYVLPFFSLFWPAAFLAERFDWRALCALACGLLCTAAHVLGGRMTTKRAYLLALLAMFGALIGGGLLLEAAKGEAGL